MVAQALIKKLLLIDSENNIYESVTSPFLLQTQSVSMDIERNLFIPFEQSLTIYTSSLSKHHENFENFHQGICPRVSSTKALPKQSSTIF